MVSSRSAASVLRLSISVLHLAISCSYYRMICTIKSYWLSWFLPIDPEVLYWFEGMVPIFIWLIVLS